VGLQLLHFLLYVGLNTSVNGDAEKISNLFQVILSNGFPKLRICTAVGIGTFVSSKTWKGSPALRSLHLDMETSHDYEQLLSTCPHLHHFTSDGLAWANQRTGMIFFSLKYHTRVCTPVNKLV
jgi:hypothetical protein